MQNVNLEQERKSLVEQLDSYIKNHYEELIEKFAECFKKYCNKIRMMQQAGKKEKIAYIHFSVLRTNILLKKHEIRIDAFDENWYMDPMECSYSYPVNEIYTYLEKYSNVVEELWKQSTDLNDFSDVYRKVFLESNIYLFYVAEIIRQGMRKLIETEEYKSVAKAECFVVCIGGYMDKFDILYKEDYTKKDSAVVRRRLQSGKQKIFSYEIFEKLDLSKGDYRDLEFQYSSFDNSNLSNSDMTKCRFIICNFKSAILKDVRMDKAKIFGTDFSGALLQNVDFSGAKLKSIIFKNAKLINVDFSKALLAEDMNFENAKCENCIFPESR